MAILNIENDIITQLQGNISELKVEGQPARPKEYKLLHQKGAVIVHFQEGVYSKPEQIDLVQQLADLKFGLTLFIRGLRDKNEAYNYIDTVISALSGYEPTGCGKMYLTRVGFSSEDNGIYQYNFSFTVPTENYSQK